MPEIELTYEKALCSRCGTAYGRRKGNFPVCYAESYKGLGYLHICRDCLGAMYNDYFVQCNDAKMAVRQMCRKLDLYWNEKIFNAVASQNTNRTMMTTYITKINAVAQSGKSYDTTLIEEGVLWSEDTAPVIKQSDPEPERSDEEDIPEETVEFWGRGYSADEYAELDRRFNYWKSGLNVNGKFDIATETLIKQICAFEIDINERRAAGKSVDKQVSMLNTLLGSANLKPVQKASEVDAGINGTPLGVWIYRYEKQRPLPEIDDDLKDVNSLKKYVFTWMGHLCKMLGIKNAYAKLYEDAIEEHSVDMPEHYGDDDDS